MTDEPPPPRLLAMCQRLTAEGRREHAVEVYREWQRGQAKVRRVRAERQFHHPVPREPGED